MAKTIVYKGESEKAVVNIAQYSSTAKREFEEMIKGSSPQTVRDLVPLKKKLVSLYENCYWFQAVMTKNIGKKVSWLLKRRLNNTLIRIIADAKSVEFDLAPHNFKKKYHLTTLNTSGVRLEVNKISKNAVILRNYDIL